MFFVFFLVMARMSLCGNFLLRVYDAFKGSIFEMKKMNIILPIVLCAFMLMTVVSWTALIHHQYLSDSGSAKKTYDEKSYDLLLIVVTAMMLLFDASGSWAMVLTMIHKLLQTVELSDRSEYISRMKRLRPPSVSPAVVLDPAATIQEDRTLEMVQMDSPKEEDNGPPVTPHSPSVPSSSLDHGQIEKMGTESVPSTPSVATNPAASSRGFRTISDSLNFMTLPSLRNETVELQMDLAFNTLQDRDKPFLGLITKHLLMGTLSIIPSQVCYVAIIIVCVLKAYRVDLNLNALFLVFLGVLYPAEVVMNFASLYLTNRFGKERYSVLCERCDTCCAHRCVYPIAAKRILKGKHRNIIEQVGHKVSATEK